MTTYVDFTPSASTPFQFQATLDGAVYTIIVTWNLFGQRYYVSAYALDGTRIFTLPMIGSPNGRTIASLGFSGGLALATLPVPHELRVGTIAAVTVTGATPAAYNGPVLATIINATQFAYPLSADPGPATFPGTVFYNISLSAGYFASTLVWRVQNGQFEINP